MALRVEDLWGFVYYRMDFVATCPIAEGRGYAWSTHEHLRAVVEAPRPLANRVSLWMMRPSSQAG